MGWHGRRASRKPPCPADDRRLGADFTTLRVFFRLDSGIGPMSWRGCGTCIGNLTFPACRLQAPPSHNRPCSGPHRASGAKHSSAPDLVIGGQQAEGIAVQIAKARRDNGLDGFGPCKRLRVSATCLAPAGRQPVAPGGKTPMQFGCAYCTVPHVFNNSQGTV